jgi:hypothetical protein
MFTTFKQRLILGIFVVIILSIPIGAYVISEQKSKSDGSSEANKDRNITPFSQPVTSAPPTTSTPIDLSSTLQEQVDEATSSPPLIAEVTSTANSFGPTLNFKVTLEGRPLSNQATKLFVGISDATKTGVPQYLLSFNVDLPAGGTFTGLSLAGLTAGLQYSAYIKGPAQIATSSAFTMDTNTSYLNNNQAILMTTGDLNEDNIINSADYAIAKNLYGTNENSKNWNANVDLNKDGIINAYDLAIISKNIGKIGASGVWQSTPQTGGSSPYQNLGGPSPQASSSGSPAGYWMWFPKI